MSRFPRLAKTFQVLVLAALPLGITGCCGEIEDHVRESNINPDAPAYKELVDACIADDLSCAALCTEILRQEGEQQADEASFSECRIMDTAATEVHMTYSFPYDCVAGRKPAGLAGCLPANARSPVGMWLAQMAHLEAAAIYAFANTARQLARHQAPWDLVASSVAAIAQEVDHARIMAGLARRWGVEPPTVYMSQPPDQSVFELCVDNAVEGCVRETYGAVVATFQSHAATDPAVRAAMVQIARDETSHAETSFAIDRWARAQLDDGQLARVDRAVDRAIDEVIASADEPVEPEIAALLGVPGPNEKRKLLADLRTRVWS
jgi:hypothetical protein